MQQELNEVAQALDPVCLLEHVQHLQQALFQYAVEANPFVSPAAVVPLRVFTVESCTTGEVPAREGISDPSRGPPALYQQQEKRKRVLGWRRTHNDPFEGAWEQIASWVQAHPERSSGDIFRELQRLSPGRYQPLQIRTLQRGMRKIRAFLLETAPEPWPQEVIHGQVSDLIEPAQRTQEAGEETCSLCSSTLASPVVPAQENASERPFPARPGAKEESPQETATSPGGPPVIKADGEPSQARHASSLSGESNGPRKRQRSQTIERAVHDYLEDQRSHHRRPKTLEWHQMALGLFQHYLLSVCHLTLLNHITEKEIQGWLAFLGQQPTCRGNLRTTGTIASYLRSARAFCQWVVRHTSLKSTPFAHLPLLKAEPLLLQLLEPEEWEGLLLACQPPEETDMLAERAMARNQAILWVLADTGMCVSEICGLRLSDVDQECGILTVKEKGSKQRQLPLGQIGRHALLSYLDQRRPETVEAVDQRDACEDPLFLSDTGRSLTDNGIALLFGRLRKRAGVTRKGVGPSLLRDSFAVRYVQAGGDLCTLRELLGQQESTTVKRYLRMSE
jgi:site-specific recombinase XerD